ncbi:hypothetical protein LAJ55_14255, partial [Streptococcus pneumoniae]|uniref:hypothetical protein n=1 Tax=Streptococcus pneumoniae TaxID=1313 RepID=UPI001CBAAA3C
TANITIPASVPAATETVAGIQEIATQAETNTGTVDDKFLTPLKLTSWPRVPQSFAIANLATTPVGSGEGQQIWSTVENEILTWMAGE